MTLSTIIDLIDSKIEQFIKAHSNYPKYLLMGSKVYITFYKSHFITLKGNMPLTLNIDVYKNLEIIIVPNNPNLIELSGEYEITDNTLLEIALKDTL